MKTAELTERIRLPEEARRLAGKEQISRQEYDIWREKFDRDIRQFMRDWKELENRYVWALEFYLKLAADTYVEYQKRGDPDEVFDATFYDLTIWCRECYRKHGVYGLAELEWLGQSVRLELFRLGRLQFEPIVTKKDMRGKENTLPAGTKALKVHIPEGEPLAPEVCQASFDQAEEFFKGEYEAYICESWLLSLHLKEILPETSNIIRFQDFFEVTGTKYSSPQAEERIFGEVLEDKRQYPEATSLQRKAKEYLLSGGDLGIGEGFFYSRERTGMDVRK